MGLAIYTAVSGKTVGQCNLRQVDKAESQVTIQRRGAGFRDSYRKNREGGGFRKGFYWKA